MKRTSINTQKKIIFESVNNGFSFPILSGCTYPVFHSTSTHEISENKNKYAICSDWVEFICTWEQSISARLTNHINGEIIVKQISVHKNPNFRYLHRIYLNGCEVCDMFSSPNNGAHAFDEVSIKVSNSLLYTTNWLDSIRCIVRTFRLEFKRMARWDIALDGQDILKLDDVLNKYTKSHTVQCNNEAIRILPMHFNKHDHRWSGWYIGKKKSGISARCYDKTHEIQTSGKDYVKEFWHRNRIAPEEVGRFEVQLNYSRLKKYRIDLSNMDMLSNADYLGTVLREEVESWIQFYRVRRKDVLNHKKETAINRGREIQFIKWNHLPKRTELLEYNIHVPQRSVINARNSISFVLDEILTNPSTSTTAQVEFIDQCATKYHLEEFVQRKIKMLFRHESESPYVEFLLRIIHSDFETDETKNGF